jgi:CO/xanthine dehydrogenase Mo-binding subunit
VAVVAGPDKNTVDRLAAECVVRADPLAENFSFEKFSSDRLAAKRMAIIGDPDAAFASAARIVEGISRTGRQEHWYAEPQAALAAFAYDKMEVFSATQWPFHVRQSVAAALDVRLEDIVVRPCEVGVHLDGKLWYPSLIAAQTALAAVICRKSVKLTLTREEDLRFSPKRPPVVLRHRAAIGPAGELLALEVRVVVDVGAAAPFAEETLDRLCLGSLGCYRCADVRIEGFAVRTNTPPAGPFAGFGLAQAFFAVERHASRVAEMTDAEPVEWRKRNAVARSDRVGPLAGLRDHVPIVELLDTAVAMSDYRRKWAAYELLKRSRDARREGPLRGIGAAISYQGNGFLWGGAVGGASTVGVTLEKDGTLLIASSAVSGSRETVALWKKIAADALSIPIDDVSFVENRTDAVPDSGPSSLSRNVTTVTRLIERCCLTIRKQRFRDPLPITVRKTSRAVKGQGWDALHMQGSPFAQFSWGAAVVEVEIDPELFDPHVRGVWFCVDGGRILSERKARSSLENSCLHALGWALRERIEAEEGRYPGSVALGYRMMQPSEAPPVKIDFLWNDSTVPKGIGELPFSSVPAAFAQAVSQAAGVTFDDLPIDALAIRDALEEL